MITALAIITIACLVCVASLALGIYIGMASSRRWTQKLADSLSELLVAHDNTEAARCDKLEAQLDQIHNMQVGLSEQVDKIQTY